MEKWTEHPNWIGINNNKYVGYVESLDISKELLREYSYSTSSTFVVLNSTKDFGKSGPSGIWLNYSYVLVLHKSILVLTVIGILSIIIFLSQELSKFIHRLHKYKKARVCAIRPGLHSTRASNGPDNNNKKSSHNYAYVFWINNCQNYSLLLDFSKHLDSYSEICSHNKII